MQLFLVSSSKFFRNIWLPWINCIFALISMKCNAIGSIHIHCLWMCTFLCNREQTLFVLFSNRINVKDISQFISCNRTCQVNQIKYSLYGQCTNMKRTSILLRKLVKVIMVKCIVQNANIEKSRQPLTNAGNHSFFSLWYFVHDY